MRRRQIEERMKEKTQGLLYPHWWLLLLFLWGSAHSILGLSHWGFVQAPNHYHPRWTGVPEVKQTEPRRKWWLLVRWLLVKVKVHSHVPLIITAIAQGYSKADLGSHSWVRVGLAKASLHLREPSTSYNDQLLGLACCTVTVVSNTVLYCLESETRADFKSCRPYPHGHTQVLNVTGDSVWTCGVVRQ